MSYTIVIFGANGDLSKRKLIPALYNLSISNSLDEDIRIVGVGRRDYTIDEYHSEVYESLNEYSRNLMEMPNWENFKYKIHYYKMDFKNKDEYIGLDKYLNTFSDNKINEKRVYYLAVAPEYFGLIVDELRIHKMNSYNNSWPKLVIEKPFGSDLATSKILNSKILTAFDEERIYRIDHYLAKEMFQNIMVLRFGNTIFEPIWNNKFIKEIQITSSESIGIGLRGEFYETSGAIRDMVQSHLLQLLTLITMDKPKLLNAKDIKDEKVKVLKSLKKYEVNEVNDYVVRGQYDNYRTEQKVSSESNTETYVAIKTYINNSRWNNVPIYIRTGKKLKEKLTQIVIEFKPTLDNLYGNLEQPNYLVINIQPNEDISIHFNTKLPGLIQNINSVNMTYCQNCQIPNNHPEAYEILFFDIIKGDSNLFTRWDEVENSWEFIDSIINGWNNTKPKFPNYKSGSWGPDESSILLEKDRTEWKTFEN